MAAQTPRRVLVVGAGAVGIVYGYILSLAKVEVTFLVRPHRAKALDQPQVLYRYNDHQLKTFSEYKYITDPSQISEIVYDYIIVTLDNAALSSEAGQTLAKSIGTAVQAKKTVVILQRIALDLVSWFIKTSNLPDHQVITCLFTIHIYSPKLVTLPQHPPTNKTLLAQADWAYIDNFPASLFLDDSQPTVVNEFLEMYNGSGVSAAAPMGVEQMNAMFIPFFAAFAGMTLLNWPPLTSLSSLTREQSDDWNLAITAYREIQSLFLPPGEVEKTSSETVIAAMKNMEKTLWPLDFVAFNGYHHGGKVSRQDGMLLRGCVNMGQKKGFGMDALKGLIEKSEALTAA